jgi:hypothetical protein
LNFAVKLELTQPGEALVEEMSRVLDAYLHQSMVAQPIEYFHSLFLALFRGEPLTLWSIQEEEPAQIRYVTDDGEETLSRRFEGTDIKGDVSLFPGKFRAAIMAEDGECASCELIGNCAGYFKWPDPDYPCDGVKTLFRTLNEAARQLKKDLDAYDSAHREKPA